MSTGSYASKQGGSGAGLAGAAALLLGILVAVLGFFVFMMWADAHNARDDARQASASTATSGMAGMDMAGSVNAGSLTSYAGAAPANADELASAHKPYPAVLPAVPAGAVADVKLALTDINIEVAPGVHYAAWAWAGGAWNP